MNPYHYSNWNYGYTLGPASEQSRGAYTVGAPSAVYGGRNPANLASLQSGQGGWAGIKATQPAQPTPKAQVGWGSIVEMM